MIFGRQVWNPRFFQRKFAKTAKGRKGFSWLIFDNRIRFGTSSCFVLQTFNFSVSCANFLRKITTDVTDHADYCCRLDRDREVSSVPIREIRGSIPLVAAEGRAKLKGFRFVYGLVTLIPGCER